MACDLQLAAHRNCAAQSQIPGATAALHLNPRTKRETTQARVKAKGKRGRVETTADVRVRTRSSAERRVRGRLRCHGGREACPRVRAPGDARGAEERRGRRRAAGQRADAQAVSAATRGPFSSHEFPSVHPLGT